MLVCLVCVLVAECSKQSSYVGLLLVCWCAVVGGGCHKWVNCLLGVHHSMSSVAPPNPLNRALKLCFFHSSASFIRVFQTCLPANENWDDAWQGEAKYLVTEEVVADKMSFTVSSQVLKPAVLTGKC